MAPASPAALHVTLEALERDGTAAQLRAVAATLTPVERRALAAEVAEGDRLAELVVAVLATAPSEGAAQPSTGWPALVVRCSNCGGDGWLPAQDDDLERCVACGALVPFTGPDDTPAPSPGREGA